MIAEIKGKVNSANTNLTERREDELTGNFFGNMRYIPFERGLKTVLQNGMRPTELRDMIAKIDVGYWADRIFFWEKVREGDRYTEPDVRMDFPTVTIGVEVKYHSGLSDQEDPEVPEAAEDLKAAESSFFAEKSGRQLSREARALRSVGKDTEKLLLLLADEAECTAMLRGAKIIDGVKLGYLSWQEALAQLKKLTDLNDYEQIIVTDVIELLEKKGFARFRDFLLDAPDIDREDFWHFDLSDDTTGFSFGCDTDVEDGYYEFG